MQPRRFLRSASFRLVVWYAAVFGTSVALLLAIVYWIVVSALNQQLRDAVERELTVLTEVYRNRGVDRAAAGIQLRVAELSPPRMYYLLQDAAGRRIAGNFPPMTPREGWAVMAIPAAGAGEGPVKPSAGSSLLAQGVRLPNGEFLLVGENRYRVVKAEEAIIGALGGGIAITVLLAFAGGALLAVGFLRRIEEINRTSRSIMAGNLFNRVPTRGSGDEMDQLAINLNAMLDRIQVLMESLKRVSDDIAHDLRTPLSRLRQRLEVARDRARTPEDYAAVVDRSLAEVDAILETFAALLRIAQIEAGSRRASFSDVSLEGVVHTVSEIYAPVAEDNGQRLEASVECAALVDGDRDLLMQMTANLLENSIRHCPPGALIAVRLAAEGGAPVLRVADNGPGIPAAERERVFRRFYRLDASRSTPGSGLGLALVKAVADLHGATVELSDNHPGLRVVVRFRAFGGPLRPAQPVRHEIAPEPLRDTP
ncbi:MAG TPA: ATP-binding protein [Burkholderiales bacterium]|nr:ATP-binding protein [Burkholderiales bacterium]